jgi:hypothetical protein
MKNAHHDILHLALVNVAAIYRGQLLADLIHRRAFEAELLRRLRCRIRCGGVRAITDHAGGARPNRIWIA